MSEQDSNTSFNSDVPTRKYSDFKTDYIRTNKGKIKEQEKPQLLIELRQILFKQTFFSSKWKSSKRWRHTTSKLSENNSLTNSESKDAPRPILKTFKSLFSKKPIQENINSQFTPQELDDSFSNESLESKSDEPEYVTFNKPGFFISNTVNPNFLEKKEELSMKDIDIIHNF